MVFNYATNLTFLKYDIAPHTKTNLKVHSLSSIFQAAITKRHPRHKPLIRWSQFLCNLKLTAGSLLNQLKFKHIFILNHVWAEVQGVLDPVSGRKPGERGEDYDL
jgi:hypothetical protein